MYDHFWQQLIRFLKKLKITLTITYVWDIKTKKFVTVGNKMYAKKNTVVMYVVYANMIVIAWNVVQVSRKDRIAIFQIISFGTGAVAALVTVSRWLHHNGAAEIVQFLNCMVRFQRNSTERGNNCIK
jgi:hypothetical protein